ncbi:MAG: pentapeptide repeat-containing protein [Oscillatoriales cyanobacterium C42_A2020_001]|nr:pentapeptide repeat-containing protein [Leptolyngbyaceae cyanobacterium C42_A2020_001]
MNSEDLLKQYATGERNFPAAKLSEANLSGVNLSRANLSGANLSVANLCGSNLSEANLSKAKLNVAKLSGANLSKANLEETNLNVANLTLADLSHAELRHASLVRAEMARAELSAANLSYANLSGVDLKDAKLRNANLSHANISRATLKWATFTSANLTQANLHGTDLSSSDLSGADLSHTELRQANLSRANLRGANLSGANLRWADLSGADLSWADLSGARLSGANLTGVNLSYANLLGTILVHADLTRASLIGADWAGSDLSGATLTGAKLHGVLRFGIKTEGILCEWVDLSPNGDQSDICHLPTERLRLFFHEMPPTVRLTIDAEFDPEAHYALAATYCQLARRYQIMLPPPNIRVGRRRTALTFEMKSDDELFLASYVAILPFKDAACAQENLLSLLKLLRGEDLSGDAKPMPLAQELETALNQFAAKAEGVQLPASCEMLLKKATFFEAPTQTTLVTSKSQNLTIYTHPCFGKRVVPGSAFVNPPTAAIAEGTGSELPSLSSLVDFVQSFHAPEAISISKNGSGESEKKQTLKGME